MRSAPPLNTRPLNAMEQNLLHFFRMEKLSPDAQMFLIPLCILVGLLLIAIVRIVFLLRTNRKLLAQQEKMEQQVLTQQRDVIAVRQDGNMWRGALQMQVDAFRAEASRRLEDAELRYDQVVKQHEVRITELQSTLAEALAKAPAPQAPQPIEAPLPSSPPVIVLPERSPISVMPNGVVLPVIDEMAGR